MLLARQLGDWDWRWRAPFDSDVGRDVQAAADELERQGHVAHASTLRDLHSEAYRTASLGGLLTSLEDQPDPERRQAMLDAAGDVALNGVPSFMANVLERRIAQMAANVGEQSDLLALLRSATRRDWVEPHSESLRIVFGDDLAGVIRHAHELRDLVRPDEPMSGRVSADEVPEVLAAFQRKHPRLGELLARFRLDVVSAEGFGAYWPAELTDDTRDRLEISANDDSLGRTTLEQTLAHEVAGHGVFYEALRRAQPTFVDHGALALIEGWATFAEWRLPGMRGPDAARLAWVDLIGAGEEDVGRRVPEFVAAQGYSEEQVEAALFSWTQLPAFQLSYMLGGLWFARRASTFADGVEMLYAILREPVGDFLRLY